MEQTAIFKYTILPTGYVMNNDPNCPAGQALNTAGLTQAFSETAGLDCRKLCFQNQSWAGPG